MSGFEQRLERGNIWADEVRRIVEAKGWLTVPIGAENLTPKVSAALSRMKNPDVTVSFIRYLPDGFAINVGLEQAFFFDAKVGKSIQKEAYEVYLAFANRSRKMFLFIHAEGCNYCIPVQKLCFLDSQKYVNRFPLNQQLPVDDEGWIAPRLWPQSKYLDWKARNPNASGTPFRYFDLEAMKKFKLKENLRK